MKPWWYEWSKPRTVFAVMFYSLFCSLILKQIEIPPVLNTIVSTLFGYYYGSQQAKQIQEGSNGQP